MIRIAGLLLAPGAGANKDHEGLVAVEEALGDKIRVLRVDFPYMIAGKKIPDKTPVLVDTICQASKQFALELGVPLESIAVGGRSMGGRMASLAVAGGLKTAGLISISYPLHAPGKPEQKRSEHFPNISVPCLFVSGDRDAFATPEELETAIRTINGPTKLVFIPKGNHGLKNRHQEAANAVAGFIDTLAK